MKTITYDETVWGLARREPTTEMLLKGDNLILSTYEDDLRYVSGSVYRAMFKVGEAKEDRCAKCGQIEAGQTGEYPCSECGIPVLHDTVSEQAP
jgi:hypothetical protein